MQRFLALAIVSSASGCSLIYNPSNLPTPRDADIDAYVADANPALVELLAVGPATLFEGQGVDGARPGVLTLVGHQFVGPVTVELVLPTNLPRVPAIVVDNAAQQVAPGRDVVMVPVSIAIDTMIDETSIPATVKITQADGMGGTASATLANKLQIRMLRELDAAQIDSAMVGALYSRVRVPGGIVFTRGAGKPPVTIRAISKIELGAMDVSAKDAVPGPGGFAGGAAGAGGGGNGGGHPGTALSAGGSGAGFASMGDPGGGGVAGGPVIGDPLISTYGGSGTAPNYGSGGGGAAGAGGGGGGTLELTSGGDLVVGDINAVGGDGSSTATTGAGGGAGGAVILRAGGALSAAMITAAGGARGTTTNLTFGGGAGSEGRIRIDAATVTSAPSIKAGALHAGASFDPTTPLATPDANPSLTIHGSAGDAFDARVLDAAGAFKSVSTFELTAAPTGTAQPMLEPGYNRVCISPKNTGTNAESTTCIELAYLP